MKEPIAVSNKDWQNLIGIQHALGGPQDRINGLSCYGLLKEVYKGLSVELPVRDEKKITAELLATEGKNWIKIPKPEPYCAALMLNKSETGQHRFHVGVVTPECGLLHSTPGKGVIHSKLDKYTHCIVGYYAYKPGDGDFSLPDAGSGDTARVIGMVVVTVIAAIATWYVGGAGGWAVGAGFSASQASFMGAMVGMAVMIGGSLLVNSLCPVASAEQDALSLSGGAGSGSQSDTRTYAWDGIVNETRQGLVKPRTFGRMLIGGQMVSEKTWYDSTGLLHYYNVLVCPAKNRITRFEQFFINDSAAEYYSDVILDTRLGDDEQTVIPGFEEIYTQYASGAKILWDISSVNPTPNHVVAFSSKAKCTGARVSVTAPNGLFSMDQYTGTKTAQTVNFRIQYKKTSEDSSKWKYAYSAYSWAASYVLSSAGFTGRAVQGFDTIGEVEGIKFNFYPYRQQIQSATYVPAVDPTYDPYVPGVPAYWDLSGFNFGWMKYEVWYKALSDSDWTLYRTYEYGYNGCTSPAYETTQVEITGLELAKYQVRINFVDSNDTHVYTPDPNNPDTVNIFAGSYKDVGPLGPTQWQWYAGLLGVFTVNTIFTAVGTATLSIAGNSASPGTSVSKSFDIFGLDEEFYDFRVWRTTADVISPYWRYDIYLKDYSEVLPVTLAYPGHALVGVQAIATERLSGSRPKISQIVVGEPLSVPEVAKQYNTTVVSDEGFQINGLRSVIVNTALPAWDTVSYFWLVRMDSSGYAQPDRLLTKFFLRVVSWQDVEPADETTLVSQARLNIQSSEEIPAGTAVMLFAEADAPTNNTAWVLAKMLIEGSRGRITEEKIHWPSFAVWNTWNEELVWDSITEKYRKRHQFDGVIDFQSDLWSLALMVASSARGMILASAGKYKVVADKAETHTQVFSEGNTKNAVVNPIPRTERANIVVTSFDDEINMFTSTTISEEDVQGNEFPIVKSVDLKVGITREFQIRNNLKWMLAHNRYIDHTIEFEAGPDSIECEVGDVFLFQSKVADFAFGGRIKGFSERMVEPEVITGAVTLANTRLSLADGFAFADFSSEEKLTPYLGSKLVITDSAGKQATGYIKLASAYGFYQNRGAAGVWYSPDNTNWTCCNVTPATLLANSGIIGYADFPGYGLYSVYEGSAGTWNLLNTVHADIIVATKTKLFANYPVWGLYERTHGVGSWVLINAGSGVEATEMVVHDDILYCKFNTTGDNVYMYGGVADSWTQIFTGMPSANTLPETGVTIVSTPGGTVRNWERIESGFNGYDPAGFTYEIVVLIIEPTVFLDQKMTAYDEEYELTIWGKDGPVKWSGNLNGVDIEELPRPAGLPDAMPYEYPFILSKLSDDRTKYRVLNMKTSTTTMFSTITGIQYKEEIYAND